MLNSQYNSLTQNFGVWGLLELKTVDIIADHDFYRVHATGHEL